MLKTVLLSGLATGIIIGVAIAASTPSHAQQRPLIDCSLESGTTKVCVVNERKSDIIGIDCSGFWGTTPISIPGGSIPPGGMWIVDFVKGSCTKHLTIKFESGPPVERDGFDTTKNTILWTGKGAANHSSDQ